jgi:hypothetical protein
VADLVLAQSIDPLHRVVPVLKDEQRRRRHPVRTKSFVLQQNRATMRPRAAMLQRKREPQRFGTIASNVAANEVSTRHPALDGFRAVARTSVPLLTPQTVF